MASRAAFTPAGNIITFRRKEKVPTLPRHRAIRSIMLMGAHDIIAMPLLGFDARRRCGAGQPAFTSRLMPAQFRAEFPRFLGRFASAQLLERIHTHTLLRYFHAWRRDASAIAVIARYAESAGQPLRWLSAPAEIRHSSRQRHFANGNRRADALRPLCAT